MISHKQNRKKKDIDDLSIITLKKETVVRLQEEISGSTEAIKKMDQNDSVSLISNIR